MRVFFDTNILVYLFDADAADKKRRLVARFETEVSAGRVILEHPGSPEFYVAVTRKLSVPLEPGAAEGVIVRNLSMLPVIGVNAERVLYCPSAEAAGCNSLFGISPPLTCRDLPVKIIPEGLSL